MSTYDTAGLIKTVFSIDFTELNTKIGDMTKKIANNAKLLTQLTSDLFQARAAAEDLTSKVMEDRKSADEAIFLLQRRVTELERKWEEDLPNDYTGLKAFTTNQTSTTTLLKALEEKIIEVENCDGVKVQAAVEKNVGRHLRRWYGPVRDKECSELKQDLNTLRTDIEKRLLDELDVTESSLTVRINEGAALATQELREVSEEKDMQISQLRSLHLADKDELTNIINFNEKSGKRDMQMMDERIGKRFDVGEVRTAALYYTLNLDEAKVESLYEDGKAGRPSQTSAGEDPRVTLVHNTLPFLDLRSKTQQDIRVRLKQSKEEDQDDFSRTVGEVLRDLKKKPDTSRVLQMIQDNVDQALYETVDLMKGKVAAIENDKVGVVEFEDSMRIKSDQKVVDTKADRTFVNQLFEFLRTKVDQLQQTQGDALIDTVRQVIETDYASLAQRAASPGADPAGLATPLSTFGGADGGTTVVSSAQLRQPRPPGARPGTAALGANASDRLLIAAGEGVFSTPPAAAAHRGVVGDDPRDVRQRQKEIEAAVNPDTPYRWASEGWRGMHPSHNPRKHQTAPASATSRRRRPQPPPDTAPPSGQVNPFEPPAPMGSTRAYDEYVQAVQYNEGVSSALEREPVDPYVGESQRHRHELAPPG